MLWFGKIFIAVNYFRKTVHRRCLVGFWIYQGSKYASVWVCYNHVHKIMKHFKILAWFDSPQVMWCMKSITKNIEHELSYKLPNDLRLRILGNQEIMEKLQKWGEAEPSTQSPFQEKNLGTSSQKWQKKQISNFSILSSFPWFLDIVSLILTAIVECAWIIPEYVWWSLYIP